MNMEWHNDPLTGRLDLFERDILSGDLIRPIPGGRERITHILGKEIRTTEIDPLPLPLAWWDACSPILRKTEEERKAEILRNPKELASICKAQLELKPCRWCGDGHGFWGNKRECGRKALVDDRCSEAAIGENRVTAFIREKFEISEGAANEKIAEMRNAGVVTTYECGRLFFND